MVAAGRAEFLFGFFAKPNSKVLPLLWMAFLEVRPFLPIVALISLLLAWGLFKLVPWVRIVTIALAVLNVLDAMYNLVLLVVFTAMAPSHVFARSAHVILLSCQLGIGSWIFWYLLKPLVKAAFQSRSRL